MASEQEYRDKFAISQSSLRDWKVMTPAKWHATWVTKKIPRTESAATTVGSVLDCIRFTPKNFDKRFFISDSSLPSEKIVSIIDAMILHVNTLNKNAKKLNDDPAHTGPKVPLKKHTLTDKGLIASLCDKLDHFYGKPDRQFDDVIKKGTTYFNMIKEAKGRKILSTQDSNLAKELAEILITDKISKGFFEPKPECEVMFQVQIFSEFDLSGYENIEFLPIKGAVDILHFNHKRKEIREVDLKFTATPYPEFYETIRRFDYIGQHSFYDNLIRQWLITYKEGVYKDYVVMPPLNIVIDGVDKIPYIYMYNPDDLYIKRHGIENTNIKGWEDSIKDIAWHFDNEDWTRPREHIKNGFLTVKAFNKR